MSEPKRGMVAGQPIQTGVVSKEYEDGFARTFGERKPARGRFVYRRNPETGELEPVNVSQDFIGEARDGNRRSEEEIYGHATATDGTNLSTKKRHRDYMRENGLAMASEYTETWAKAKKEREAIQNGTEDRKGWRDAIGRALYKHKKL